MAQPQPSPSCLLQVFTERCCQAQPHSVHEQGKQQCQGDSETLLMIKDAGVVLGDKGIYFPYCIQGQVAQG